MKKREKGKKGEKIQAKTKKSVTLKPQKTSNEKTNKKT
jgi:hypothetical protein